MEQSAQREIREVNPDWSVSELMARIAKALVSDGPALSFGSTRESHLLPRISLVVNTTGSSGASKSVGLSASALLASAQGSHKFLGAEFGTRWSLLLPLTHIAGINILIRSLELGTEPIDLRAHQGEYPKADFTAIVPTQLYRALHTDNHLLEHLQNAQAVLVGGAALTPELSEKAKKLGVNVITSYGMTETSGGCIYDGVPLEGVEVKVGADSKILISGAVVATTYVGAPTLWETVFKDGWYQTSDSGHFAHDRLVVDGRVDDVIISGGENISLSAIESALHAHFPHKNFAAFAVHDSEWGQALHLAVAGEGFPLEDEISEYLQAQFGDVGKPKGFLYLPELPLLGIGKIDRRRLVELVMEAPN